MPAPLPSRLASTVLPAATSLTKTSGSALASSATRFVAALANAIRLPSAEIAGAPTGTPGLMARPPPVEPEVPSAAAPAGPSARLTSSVSPVRLSRRNTLMKRSSSSADRSSSAERKTVKRPSWLIATGFSPERSGERRWLALTPLRNAPVPLGRER